MTPFLLNLFEDLDLDLDLDLDNQYLLEAILEARKAFGRSSPNPPVGAVIVKNNRIISRGHTLPYGGNHAEVEAILGAKKQNLNIKNSQIYVSLEPCTHYGKTPPCINLIKRVGINKVIYASRDFNLRQQNLDSELIRQTKNKRLINLANLLVEPFKKYIDEKKPWVITKIATTQKGHIALHENKQVSITGLETKKIVHGLRYFSDAIFVGESTDKIDKPRLTVRDYEGYYKDRSPQKYILKSRKNNQNQNSNLNRFLTELAGNGHLTAMVEPGAQLFKSLLSEKLIDELWWFVSKKKLADNSLNIFENICGESFDKKFEFKKFIQNRSLCSDVLLVAKKI